MILGYMGEQKILGSTIACGFWQGLSAPTDVQCICGINVSQRMGGRGKKCLKVLLRGGQQ